VDASLTVKTNGLAGEEAEKVEEEEEEEEEEAISFEGPVSLLLQFGQTLHHSRLRHHPSMRRANRSRLRVIHLPGTCTPDAACEAARLRYQERMVKLCARARLRADSSDIQVVMMQDLVGRLPAYDAACRAAAPADGDPALVPLHLMEGTMRLRVVNEVMAWQSPLDQTRQLFAALPRPPYGASEEVAAAYVRSLRQLTAGLPPVALVARGEEVEMFMCDNI